jgi:adenine-specific DNA-methyltransferase
LGLYLNPMTSSATGDEETDDDDKDFERTTANAVMRLNAEDGSNRKFHMVELPEGCDKVSGAFKDRYKTISEINKECVRGVGALIEYEKNQKPNLSDAISSLDAGFRALKLSQYEKG